LLVVKFYSALSHKGSSFRCSQLQFCSRPHQERGRSVFVDVWKGLNVRLAISEGETANVVRPNVDVTT
jgi:hypothetical protein